jgi:hypothetical protein
VQHGRNGAFAAAQTASKADAQHQSTRRRGTDGFMWFVSVRIEVFLEIAGIKSPILLFCKLDLLVQRWN